ncbi:MAG: hypothetical protein KJ062_13765 [Thermoanaerobaculia bacterium]|nr:hypothetical protein [Thermoanaerobaculia bacterium]
MSTDGLLARARRALKRSWGFHRPPHAFVLTEDRLVHVALPRDARAGARGATVASRELPPGTFLPGAAGAPVAGPGLLQALTALLPQKERIAAASLAVPDRFVKAALVDVEPGAERNPRELAEVVKWKVGRLYGDPVPALRVSWCPAGASADGGTRLLVLASPEETIASCEAAFTARGIRIGALEPASLALSAVASPALRGNGIVVFTDGPHVSTVFLEGGAVRFLRTRPAAADADQALQEIRLAASFVGGDAPDGPGLDVTAPLVAVPESSPVSVRLAEFRAENGGPGPVSLLPVLRERGLSSRGEESVPLVGLGLLEGAE